MTNEYLEKYRSDLEKLAEQVEDILKGNFVGFYVFGSITMGTWNPKTSDIDFFVITKTLSSANDKQALEEIHKESAKTKFGKRLDGDYIDINSLREKEFASTIPTVKQGVFEAEHLCQISADNVLSLIQDGVRIHGEKIENLGLSVSEEEFIEAAYTMLVEDAGEIDKTQEFTDLYYLLIDVLRCIYALATKKLPTKQNAIRFSKDLLDKMLYHNMIELGEGKISEFPITKELLKKIVDYGLSLKK